MQQSFARVDPGRDHDFCRLSRREFVALVGGAGMGILFGGAGAPARADEASALSDEFRAASEDFGVPEKLLKAVGYVNTRWEMPPPEDCEYEPGQLHQRGEYGIMQLAQNPWRSTLAEAAELTGIGQDRLKSERPANIRGGAALLAKLAEQGRVDVEGEGLGADAQDRTELNAWTAAVEEYGGIGLYAQEVYEVLRRGAARTTTTGEKIHLPPVAVDVPGTVEALGRGADYRRARWKGAQRNNYTRSRRERTYNISKIVIHVVEGSASSAVRTFRDPNRYASAHYVVADSGKIFQCVRHKDIAWHCGDWYYNCRSIGIEHAGWGRYKGTWSRKKMKASARLTAYIMRRHKISLKRKNFFKHRELSATKCPGRHFSFKRYFKYVRRYM